MCVAVRDLVVHGVLTDMMAGRPAVYATFASYDEVAHHSGLERADTLEALRKLDQQFGRIDRARRYAARPYEIVVLSDHGQTQGATFLQRNGYGLEDLVRRSLSSGSVAKLEAGDHHDTAVLKAIGEATGRAQADDVPGDEVGGGDAIVLGSGNLGLVYLMERNERLTLEEIDELHPDLVPALRAHPTSASCWCARAPTARSPSVRGGCATSRRGASRARIPSPPSRQPPPSTCCGPTASGTWPTSWSTASTTRSWTRGAPSRS